MRTLPLLFIGIILSASFLSLSVISAQSIIRGPYLQSQGPNSIVVRWRTDSLTDSRVYYGAAQGSTQFYSDSATLTTEHRVLVKGLQPLTKYYYSVGSSTQTLRGNDPEMYFTTAPDSLSHTPIRVWAIGDFGHGNIGEHEVRNSYLTYAANHPANFQLWLGDNAYSDGTDLEFQQKVFDTTNCFGNVFLNLPFFSTSGNHDYNSICPWQPAFCNIDPNLHSGPYLNIIDPPTEGELGGAPSHKKLYYSFDYGDIHFVVLNSELGSLNASYNWAGILNNSQNFTSPMLEWLKSDLAATTKKWKIALWHQCPYSGQNNFTDDGVQVFSIASRVHFNPIIEQYGVDMVLSGHDHNYQRSYLINGHYGYKNTFQPNMMINGTTGNPNYGEEYVKYTNGPLTGVGTVYVVAGNSSEGNSYSEFSHPAICVGYTCDTCYGSFIFDVDGDVLNAKYLSSKGNTLDNFVIRKAEWTGINESASALDRFYIYPNPFRKTTAVGYTVTDKCPVKIEVVDVNGKIVYSTVPGVREPGSYMEHLDLDRPEIAVGAYMVRINCGGQMKYRKVMRIQ